MTDIDIPGLLDQIKEVATPEQYDKIVDATAKILTVAVQSLQEHHHDDG
jgi:hypothetical protein